MNDFYHIVKLYNILSVEYCNIEKIEEICLNSEVDLDLRDCSDSPAEVWLDVLMTAYENQKICKILSECRQKYNGDHAEVLGQIIDELLMLSWNNELKDLFDRAHANLRIDIDFFHISRLYIAFGRMYDREHEIKAICHEIDIPLDLVSWGRSVAEVWLTVLRSAYENQKLRLLLDDQRQKSTVPHSFIKLLDDSLALNWNGELSELFGRAHAVRGLHHDGITEKLLPSPIKKRTDFTGMAPSDLLSPKHRIVPFLFRNDELDELEKWCKRDDKCLIRVYEGESGTGKTRLLLEGCTRMANSGDHWRAGFVNTKDAPPDWGLLLMLENPRDVLMVVDNAESHFDELDRLIRDIRQRFTKHSPNKRVRLVLLARTTKASAEGLVPARAKKMLSLQNLLKGSDTDIRLLSSPAASPEHRQLMFSTALREFCKCLDIPLCERYSRSLDHPIYERPLFIQMAALLASSIDAEGYSHNPESILEEICRGDDNYWEARLRNLHHGRAELEGLVGGINLALSYFALGHCPPTRAAALALFRTIQGFGGLQDASLELILNLLIDHSADAGNVSLVVRIPQPDILAEYLAWTHLESGEAGELLLSNTFGDSADVVDLTRALTLVSRLAGWQPEAAQRLAARIEQIIGPRRGSTIFDAALGLNSTVLRGVVACAGAYAIKDPASPDAEATMTNRLVYADRLARYGIALHETGQIRGALDAIRKAIIAYECLATDEPEVISKLASSWHNLSIVAASAELHQDALRAAQKSTRLYRDLLADPSGLYLPEFTSSLDALSSRYTEVGKVEEGLRYILEAVLIFRQLVQKEPVLFTSSLANALSNLSHILWCLRRPEKALDAGEEAYELYEKLSYVNPDSHLPDLANSLTNLSIYRLETHQVNEALVAAEKAASISIRLERINPAAFSRRAAVYLNNLAYVLDRAGNTEKAMGVAKKAVEIQYELFQANPEFYRLNLVRCLDTLADIQMHAGQHDEANAVLEKSLNLIMPLVEKCSPNAILFAERLANKYICCLKILRVELDEDILRKLRMAIYSCERSDLVKN